MGVEFKCSASCGACNSEGYEARHIAFLVSHATPESVFFDVGAHAGLYSVALAPLVKQVIAIEPVTMDTLLLNVEPFPNVVPISAAAWNESVEVGMEDRTNGQSFVKGTGGIHCVPLNIFAGNGTILPGCRILFKIDVEGAVFQVLQGAQELLDYTDEIAGVIEVDGNHMKRYPNTPDNFDPLLKGFTCVNDQTKNRHYTKGILC